MVVSCAGVRQLISWRVPPSPPSGWRVWPGPGGPGTSRWPRCPCCSALTNWSRPRSGTWAAEPVRPPWRGPSSPCPSSRCGCRRACGAPPHAGRGAA